jgi:hypothetical protein
MHRTRLTDLVTLLDAPVDGDALHERLRDERRIQLERLIAQESEFSECLNAHDDLRDLYLLAHSDPVELVHFEHPFLNIVKAAHYVDGFPSETSPPAASHGLRSALLDLLS